MKTELVAISALTSDPGNARKHSDRNIKAIMGSLTRFGQQKPLVVDPSGVVRAGNGTLEAAKRLGWDAVAVVRSGLEDAEMEAYALADNRTSELAEWDYERLGAALLALDGDPGDIGWEGREVAHIVSIDWTPPAPSAGDLEGFGLDEERGDEEPRVGGVTISFSKEEASDIAAVGKILEPDRDLPLRDIVLTLVHQRLL